MTRKDKNIAAIFAFLLGTFGIHRFYLGQTGLGIFYCMLMFVGISPILGFIDAILFFAMDQDKFDAKYNNWQFQDEEVRDYRQSRHKEETKSQKREQPKYKKPTTPKAAAPKKDTRSKRHHKANGVEAFKNYEYERAIKSFEQVLAIDDCDVATHFNIACAYALLENADSAFFHLDQAVSNGFNELHRIQSHDALAYLRIQDEWDDFEDNDYRLPLVPLMPIQEQTPIQLPDGKTNYIDQLKKLGELKKDGILSEEEFTTEKKRILSEVSLAK